MAIRYDKEFNKEIRLTVSSFNQKIARLEKANAGLHLPQPISVKRIKNQATSRAQLKRQLASLKRFTKRGAEKTVITEGGYELSLYELGETQRGLRYAKSLLTRQINRIADITPTVLGVKQDATYSQMGSTIYANLVARREKLNVELQKLTKEGFEAIKGRIEYNLSRINYRKEIFMNNYLDKMLFNLGYQFDYDSKKIDYIREQMLKLDENQFMKMFEREKALQEIRDYYVDTRRLTFNFNSIKDEVNSLYEGLFENIDEMVKDYL